jgi:YHS domain-containing protein
MVEIDKALTYRFQGVDQYFCSRQCQDRFIQHPHLFVGSPRQGPSPKQKGEVVIKKRELRLSIDMNDEVKSRLKNDIGILMGVKALSFNEGNIFVTYDLLQVSLEDIENAIVMSAGNLDGAITKKIKRGFIHYSEECELENLAHLTKKSGYQ